MGRWDSTDRGYDTKENTENHMIAGGGEEMSATSLEREAGARS